MDDRKANMLFAVKGTVTTVGQSMLDNDVELFAYVEVTEPSGRRVMIEKVAVCNDVRAIFRLGMSGQFFVDRMFRSGNLRCQLWGIKSDEREIFDRKNLRLQIGLLQFFNGLIRIPILGLGLFLAIPAMLQLCRCIGWPRGRMFYGAGVARVPPRKEQVMRI